MLGTGKPVKVSATIDGHAFGTTLMPLGDGTHMLPVKAPVRKAIKKEVGDAVTVTINSVTTWNLPARGPAALPSRHRHAP